MSRLPIRARLTVAFALATLAVVAGAGAFVYLRLRADLNEGVTTDLRARWRGAAEQLRQSRPRLPLVTAERQEGFAQLIGAQGEVREASGGARERGLDAAQLGRARRGRVLVERRVAGIEATARVLARPLPAERGTVLAVGESLGDRDEALAGLLRAFAIGAPAAVLLASLAGYLLAGAGLAPVEEMRRRAARMTLDRGGERLPVPAARDELRRLGETLNEMLDRMQRSVERERRFITDAGHELRSPVAVIRTELEGALRADGHDPRLRESLLASIEECDHLGQLADDLLLVARSGEGSLELRPEAVDARALLEGVRQQFSERAGARGRAVRVEADAGVTLRADPLRLRQALANLVGNALRHGDGDVRLSAAHVDGGGVALDVSDQGGFDPDVAGRAFERFARGEKARSGAGSGLGLSIVRAIAEAHGGTAEILPGAGTTVRLRLPASQRTFS